MTIIAPLFVMKPLAENVSKEVPQIFLMPDQDLGVYRPCGHKGADSGSERVFVASFIKQGGQSVRDTGWMCWEDPKEPHQPLSNHKSFRKLIYSVI